MNNPTGINFRKLLLEKEADTYYDDKHIGIIIIGFGKMGLLHSSILNMLKPGCVRIVVDKSRLLVMGLKRIFKKTIFTRNIVEDLLAKQEINAGYITTPTASHLPVFETLAEHGVKHIFIEKPPGRNLDETKTIANRNAIVMIGFQKRYALPFRHAKLLIENKVIGEPVEASAHIKSGDILTKTNRFQGLGRGVLLDLGVHLIDLLQWMIGLDEVREATYKSIYTGVDDEFKAVMISNNGARIQIESTWSDPSYRLPETMIRVKGDKGELIVTEDHLRVISSEAYPELGVTEENKPIDYYKPNYYPGYPPVNLADPEYTIENIHFLNTIATCEKPLTSIDEAVETMKIIDMLYEAAGVK